MDIQSVDDQFVAGRPPVEIAGSPSLVGVSGGVGLDHACKEKRVREEARGAQHLDGFDAEERCICNRK